MRAREMDTETESACGLPIRRQSCFGQFVHKGFFASGVCLAVQLVLACECPLENRVSIPCFGTRP